MGLEDMLYMDNETLKFIIDEYTLEPGVRKLKEILFEIVSEINLCVLTLNKTTDYTNLDFPIHITIEDIRTKYFKDKHNVKHKQVHEEHTIGMINGLWANALGVGGIIPIQAKYYPSDKSMDLKLTGMQGDVMKESMNVAQTLAWNLISEELQKEIMKLSVHVHCPEGSVPKDGPSAGTAITTAIYSLFSNKKIKNYIAITGEISLDGKITEIGGLDVKILGGLKAGIREFIFPQENKKDFDNFIEKYTNDKTIQSIKFHQVSHINQVFELVLE